MKMNPAVERFPPNVRIRNARNSTPLRQPLRCLLEALAGFDPETRWQTTIAAAYGALQEVANPDKEDLAV